MRVSLFVALSCLVLSGGKGPPSEVAPQIIYVAYLGGRHKDYATAIAVDGNGNAYVVGRTPSPDSPVTAGAFSTATRVNNDVWTGFVSKVSERGDKLLYSSFVAGNFFSSANAVTVDRQREKALTLGTPRRTKSRP